MMFAVITNTIRIALAKFVSLFKKTKTPEQKLKTILELLDDDVQLYGALAIDEDTGFITTVTYVFSCQGVSAESDATPLTQPLRVVTAEELGIVPN
jgi:hypothetical protein